MSDGGGGAVGIKVKHYSMTRVDKMYVKKEPPIKDNLPIHTGVYTPRSGCHLLIFNLREEDKSIYSEVFYRFRLRNVPTVTNRAFKQLQRKLSLIGIKTAEFTKVSPSKISLYTVPFVFDFELLLLVLETGETLLLCPLVVEAGEGVWFDWADLLLAEELAEIPDVPMVLCRGREVVVG